MVSPWAFVYMSKFSSRFWIYSELTVTNLYVFSCRFINYWKAWHHSSSRTPHYTYTHTWPQVLLKIITVIFTAECRAGGLSKVCYTNKMHQDPLKQLQEKRSLLSIKRPDRKHFMKEVRIVVPIAQMLIAAWRCAAISSRNPARLLSAVAGRITYILQLDLALCHTLRLCHHAGSI